MQKSNSLLFVLCHIALPKGRKKNPYSLVNKHNTGHGFKEYMFKMLIGQLSSANEITKCPRATFSSLVLPQILFFIKLNLFKEQHLWQLSFPLNVIGNEHSFRSDSEKARKRTGRQHSQAIFPIQTYYFKSSWKSNYQWICSWKEQKEKQIKKQW